MGFTRWRKRGLRRKCEEILKQVELRGGALLSGKLNTLPKGKHKYKR